MEERALWQQRISAFESALTRWKVLPARHTTPASESPTLQDVTVLPALDTSALAELDHQLKQCRSEIFRKARERLQELDSEWSDDPRICQGSLLDPIGLRRREVPLTRALAWLMTPYGDAGGLRASFLAATLNTLLAPPAPVTAAVARGWKVTAEENVEDTTGASGRIDIYLDGVLGRERHLLAIEAKVQAPEGRRQLEKYRLSLAERARALQARLACEDKWDRCHSHVFFLTPAGRSGSIEGATAVSYARLFPAWLDTLRLHAEDPHAPFARLLLADIARDLADQHLRDQLTGSNGALPRLS